MLRANVGISRKLTKDYNSTGFSVNLEGEINAPLDEPEVVIERIREFYDLADEALRDQIERYEGTSAIASRDKSKTAGRESTKTNGTGLQDGSKSRAPSRSAPSSQVSPDRTTNGSGNATKPDEEKATNKQTQFLLTLAKRNGLTLQTLEGRIAEILGQKIGTYDLTKRQAGQLIDSLSSIPK